MTTIQDQIQTLPEGEFDELKAWIVTTETDRRAALPAVEEATREAKEEVVAEVVGKLAEKDTKLKPPAKAGDKPRAWKPWHPLDTTTHFYYCDLATHGGKTWRDVLDETRTQLNVWEPGAPGIDERYWVEVTEGKPEPEAEATEPGNNQDNTNAVQEWKPGQDVKPGERYTFQGDTYEVLQAHTTAAHWPPDAVPALYKKI